MTTPKPPAPDQATLGTCQTWRDSHTGPHEKSPGCLDWAPLPAPKPEGRTGASVACEVEGCGWRWPQGDPRGCPDHPRRSPAPAPEETARAKFAALGPFPTGVLACAEPPTRAPEMTTLRARVRALEAALRHLRLGAPCVDGTDCWCATSNMPEWDENRGEYLHEDACREALRALSDDGAAARKPPGECQEPGCILMPHEGEPGSSHWDGKRGWTSPAPSPPSAEAAAEVPEEVRWLIDRLRDLAWTEGQEDEHGYSDSRLARNRERTDRTRDALLRALRGGKGGGR